MSARRAAPLAILLVAASLAGCTGSGAPPGGARAEVRVGGEGFGLDALTIAGTSFESRHPQRDVVVLTAMGAPDALEAVREGGLDLAVTARKDEAADAGLTFFRLYREPVLFVVHDSAGIAALRAGDIERVFRGDVTNWRELGGNDLPIRVYTNDPSHTVTRAYTAIHPQLGPASWSASVEVVDDDHALLGILAHTPGAAGFSARTPLALRDADVTFVSIDGVVATTATVLSGNYPLTLDVGIAAPPRLKGAPEELGAWLQTPQGKAALRAAGYIVE